MGRKRRDVTDGPLDATAHKVPKKARRKARKQEREQRLLDRARAASGAALLGAGALLGAAVSWVVRGRSR